MGCTARGQECELTGNYDHPKLEKSGVRRLFYSCRQPRANQTMSVILFEDGKTAKLSPAASARPAATIPCAGYRLDELLAALDLPVIHAPRPHLRNSVPTGNTKTWSQQKNDFHLLLNGRIVPNIDSLRYLQEWIKDCNPGAIFQEETLLAALVPEDTLLKWNFSAESLFANLKQKKLPPRDFSFPVFNYPHQIIQYHLDFFAENLSHRIQCNEYAQPITGLFLGPNATVDPSATIDTSKGNVLIEREAQVGPHAHLVGPVVIGANSVVLPHAAIGSHTAAENNCKLGGEISCSIISAYSNKAHFGFLGHSYLGSWVNLGAGTTNSNLKNTYGEIHLEIGKERIATGMQFLGCLIGDYTKTAIGTNIFTGKTIGACSMLYGTVAENVPSFVNYAKQFGKITTVSSSVAATIQARTFARRGITQTETDQALLNELYQLTQSDREHFSGELPEEPLVL